MASPEIVDDTQAADSRFFYIPEKTTQPNFFEISCLFYDFYCSQSELMARGYGVVSQYGAPTTTTLMFDGRGHESSLYTWQLMKAADPNHWHSHHKVSELVVRPSTVTGVTAAYSNQLSLYSATELEAEDLLRLEDSILGALNDDRTRKRISKVLERKMQARRNLAQLALMQPDSGKLDRDVWRQERDRDQLQRVIDSTGLVALYFTHLNRMPPRIQPAGNG